MDKTIVGIIFTICVFFFTDGKIVAEGCEPTQYLEMWTKGIVSCSFQEGYYGVFWYNSRNYASENPVIFYQESMKGGDGYFSGEFDIFPNGSLVINNVSLEHDHTFSVVNLTNLSDDLSVHEVRVFAMVKPLHPKPLIRSCRGKVPSCFTYWRDNSSIECSIIDSRPVVHVEWFARTTNGDMKIPSNINITERGIVTTSISRTPSPFVYSSFLSLLVCKAWSPKGMLHSNESFIFVQNSKRSLTPVNPITRYFPIHSNAVLHCTDEIISFLAWKIKQKGDASFKNILNAFWDGDLLKKNSRGSFDVTYNGSLTISKLSVHHEATYVCIYSNGSSEGMTTFNILVFVPPVPFDLEVRGCTTSSNCSLHKERQGNLTCAVRGIRPLVKLVWKALDTLFEHQQTTIVHNQDGTFDILTTIKYNGMFYPHPTLSVECQVVEENIEMFRLSKSVELFFEGVNPTTQKQTPTETKTSLLWHYITMALYTGVIIVCGTILVIFWVKGKDRESRHSISNTKPEMMPMIETSGEQRLKSLQNKPEIFVSELRERYKALCSAIKPVPFIRDKMCGIEKIFVESGLHFLNVKEGLATMEKWEPLTSFQDVFTDPRLDSKRKIVEGDLGYGKSTMALQWAFEWLTKNEHSYLKDVEILILLRLRQLGSCHSIFSAIKQFILPIDTALTVKDIEEIIYKSKSVTLILDGFDEYSTQKSDEPSDILTILKQEILLRCNVILTTRSFCLPNEFAPQTKRIKLDGFDNKARNSYLRKAVVGNDSNAADLINEKLRLNPFLDGLCQVPLFFVMFAHLAVEELGVTELKTVTMFFRHAISCLHSHMENKMKDKSVRSYGLYKDNHSKLDKESFQILLGESKQHVWLKENMQEILGHECYDWYVRTGILVEEDVLSTNVNPYDLSNDRLHYTTEVRFYHNLFGEWYAAHFLAKYLENPSEYNFELGIEDDDDRREAPPLGTVDNLNKSRKGDELLQKLDPSELQYLYRFTCGLSPIAAQKVCEHLKKTPGGDKFYIFCLCEQPANLKNLDKQIESFCSTYIIIHKQHTKLMQLSTSQLLQVASQKQIAIKEVKLSECFQSTGISGQYLLLKSGIKIPILRSLTSLVISDGSRELIDKSVREISEYCLRSTKMKSLRFDFCLLAQRLGEETLSLLKKQNIEVMWRTKFSGTYNLNRNSGEWKNQVSGEVMANELYAEVVRRFKKNNRYEGSQSQPEA